MADLPIGFWAGWVTVVTLVSLAALLWLILSVYSAKEKEHELDSEPVWDENLREGTNAPPLWWFWLLLSAMVISLAYLALYPGLGSYKGLLNWSQGIRLAESYENFDSQFAGRRMEIADYSLAEIQNDLALMDTAERIFKRECSACHGPDGRGQAAMFPNLMDVDWLWGNSAEQIEQSIRGGRRALMPAWGSVIGNDSVQQVTDYVLQMNAANADTLAGKAVFDQYCVACHGAQGAGNILLGAPNLVDSAWLYGSSRETVSTTIANGRGGVMPAFGERLDDTQIRLLVAMLAR